MRLIIPALLFNEVRVFLNFPYKKMSCMHLVLVVCQLNDFRLGNAVVK